MTVPSSFRIGWLPPSRSMMLRRVLASSVPPDSYVPDSFGPRCRSARTASCRPEGSGGVALRAATNPTIPHIGKRIPDHTVDTAAHARHVDHLDAPGNRKYVWTGGGRVNGWRHGRTPDVVHAAAPRDVAARGRGSRPADGAA